MPGGDPGITALTSRFVAVERDGVAFFQREGLAPPDANEELNTGLWRSW